MGLSRFFALAFLIGFRYSYGQTNSTYQPGATRECRANVLAW